MLAFFLSNVAIFKIGVNRTSSFIGVATVVSIIAGVYIANVKAALASYNIDYQQECLKGKV